MFCSLLKRKGLKKDVPAKVPWKEEICATTSLSIYHSSFQLFDSFSKNLLDVIESDRLKQLGRIAHKAAYIFVAARSSHYRYLQQYLSCLIECLFFNARRGLGFQFAQVEERSVITGIASAARSQRLSLLYKGQAQCCFHQKIDLLSQSYFIRSTFNETPAVKSIPSCSLPIVVI